jgi:hypothetical protein
MFLSFATILLAWYGIRMMFGSRHSGELMFGFAKLLLFIAFGYAMIAYYESPIPGMGTSFSNLITDQAAVPRQCAERPVRAGRPAEPKHALERAAATGRLVAAGEFALLDDVDRDRAGAVRAPVRRVIQHDRERRCAACRPVVCAVLHLSRRSSGLFWNWLKAFRSSTPSCWCIANAFHLHLREVSQPIPPDSSPRDAA